MQESIRARLRFLDAARSPSPHLPQDDPVCLLYFRPEQEVIREPLRMVPPSSWNPRFPVYAI